MSDAALGEIVRRSARPLLRTLVRAVAREAREDGGTIPPALVPFLSTLAAVVDGPLADSGNGDEAPETIEVQGWSTVAQLAAYSGHPPRTLRHWAAAGRVRAIRAGRTWLIDPESLKDPHASEVQQDPTRRPA